MSLRARLGLVVLVVAAATLVLFGVALLHETRADLLDTKRRTLDSSLANRVREQPPTEDGSNRPARDPRILETAHTAIDTQDRVLGFDAAGPPRSPLPVPKLARSDIRALRRGRTVFVRSVDGSVPYMVRGQPGLRAFEVEAAPLDDVDATLSALRRRFVLGALIAVALAFGAAALTLRRGLRPLDDVIATAGAVAAGEREQRIPTDTGPAELRRLSAALDHMLQQQRSLLHAREASEGRLIEFVADAAHELQTPITSVLGWAELARKGDHDPAGRAIAMTRIEAESRRMARLVSDLLVLARLDENPDQGEDHVDLVAIVKDAVTDARAVEPDRAITLHAPEVATVRGDPERLRRVVDNLLRNVRAHTPPGTGAHVRIDVDSEGVALTVRDEGPGIAEDDLARIFDRFWRADPARPRAGSPGDGSGLGLAITTALVAAHGGTIRAENDPRSGAVFTVRLPRPAKPNDPSQQR